MLNPLLGINFKTLCEYHHLTEDEIQNYTIKEVVKLNDIMISEKKRESFNKNANDAEFKRVVKKFFTIFDFLSQYWTEDEIVAACAKCVDLDQIVEEKNIPCEAIVSSPEEYAESHGYDFIRTDYAFVRRYTKQGEELLYGEQKKCHIFRCCKSHQGLIHGKIILDLLYGAYPELRQFDFSAYGCYSYNSDYEIYPKTVNCYTPFKALVEQDVDAIIKRNEEYCKFYNNGEYTPEKWAEAVKSVKMQHYFTVIRGMKPITSAVDCDE